MSALSLRLVGKRVAACFTNGHVLSIRCDDGSEVNVAWADDEGRPLMGKPMVVSSGGRLQARGIQDLARHPIARRLSAAPPSPESEESGRRNLLLGGWASPVFDSLKGN